MTYDPNIIGEITIPATAKLQPGEIVRITGPGSWEIVEPTSLAPEDIIHRVLLDHPELRMIPDPDDPWKLTRIYTCTGCREHIDLADAPKQFGSVAWCLARHQARKIRAALIERGPLAQ